MSKLNLQAATLLLCLGLGANPSFAQSFDSTVADPLDRPAMERKAIGSAMLTSVTEAEGRWVLVGERGYIFTRSGVEDQWTQAEVPTSVLLTSVLMVSSDHGWAVGHSGVILATANGGRSWQKVMDGVDGADITAQSALTEQDRRDAEFLKKEGADKPLFDIASIGDANALLTIGAYGLAYVSSDSGASWESIKYQLPNPMGAHLYDVDSLADTVFIAGEMGTILRSTNGGKDYESVESPYDGSFFGLCMLSPENVIVYGLKGHAYTSSDGGDHWQKSTIASEASINACTVIGKDVYLGNQAGEIFLSKNGGKTFSFVDAAHLGPILDLHTLSDQKLLAVGMRGQQAVDLQVSP